MEDQYLTVSQITSYISKQFKNDSNLKNVYIKGEISNYSTARSGHSYFTLKDKTSQIPAVMFKGRKGLLKFEPKNGMKVIVKGNIEVYERDGKYQLQANNITEDGLGDLHIAYEQLKKKLDKEGLFDKDHKKPIPKYPNKIGVITAQTGAAIRDIIITIKRRYPLCEILVFSTLVQGDQAAPQIIKQIRHAQQYDLDTLIVGRGGGSIEDLWPFNDENVAREIYNCKIPVISAVGHEIDNTIADYVADLRAPTPTAAAEFAVPQINEINYKVVQLKKRAHKSINDELLKNKSALETITKKQIIKNPESIYEYKQMNLDFLINSLNNSSKSIISKNQNKLTVLENSIILKNPENIYKQKENHLNKLISSLNHTSKNIISENKNKLAILENSNIFKNPESIYKQKETQLTKLISSLNYTSKDIISENKNSLKIITSNNTLKNPSVLFKSKKMNLDNQINKITFSSNNIISKNKNKLEIIKNSKTLKNPHEIKNQKQNKLLANIEKLEILNPLLTLKRGYSIAKNKDKVITSVKDVKTGDEVDIEFDDGTINTKVI